jgi:hypothetical protein
VGNASVDASARVASFAVDAVARATLDAPELLDVDVDQLSGTLTLIALRRLQAQPAELAHPDPREDARDRRGRHPQRLGDLRAR